MITSATKNVPEEEISKPEADTSQHPKLSCKGLKYAASDNSFRFNFPSSRYSYKNVLLQTFYDTTYQLVG